MSREKKEKRKRAVPIWVGVLVFVLAFVAGVMSKSLIKPSWSKEYSVEWSDEIGTLKTDKIGRAHV